VLHTPAELSQDLRP